jgi:undecaprenyl-diphosphatase
MKRFSIPTLILLALVVAHYPGPAGVHASTPDALPHALRHTAPDTSELGVRSDSMEESSPATPVQPTAEASIETPGQPPAETSLEVRAFRFLNRSLANTVFDAAMPVITDFKRWRTILILVWSLLVIFGGSKGRWSALMLIPLVAATDQLSSHIIKPLVERMRPCEVLGGVHVWYGPEGWITTPATVVRSYKSSFSFPSSHAINITASMLFLGLVYRRWLVPLLIVAVAVSCSRIYIGVHWPSDVAAGMALGGLLAWPAYLVHKKLSGKNTTQPEPDKPPSE